MDDKNKGLYAKYKVERSDGKPITGGCIVLEFKDPNARKGIKAFSNAVFRDGYRNLSIDLDNKLREYGYFEAGYDIEINETAENNWSFCEKNGWHNKEPLEYLALICGEIGEAVNECRGAEPTDNLKYELADIILRTLDFAHELGINMAASILDKMEINKTRDFSKKIK